MLAPGRASAGRGWLRVGSRREAPALGRAALAPGVMLVLDECLAVRLGLAR